MGIESEEFQNQMGFNEPAVNHEIYVKRPNQKEEKQDEFKDPDVWEKPSPLVQKKKASNWGAKPRNVQNNRNRAGGAGGVPRGNPLGAYGQVDRPAAKGDGKGDGRRNYDKPWLPPEKEVKAAKTYAEHVYPDGIGPDTDLINMIEKDLLVKNPNVNFDDIAELDETKKLL